MEQILKTMLENVRAKTPLVHNITNYVTVNDVANVLLAAGGSPIMSDDADDVEDITSICGGLNINIGTLNKNTIPSMFLAGKKANELGHIVLLDPVGAGASRLRTDTANRLMREVRFDAVRGNISEIKTLALGSGTTKGVDADAVRYQWQYAIDNKNWIDIDGANNREYEAVMTANNAGGYWRVSVSVPDQEQGDEEA